MTMTRSIPSLLLTLLSFVSVAQQNASPQPTVKWKFQIKQPFYGSPLVTADRVYIGGLDSTCYALDLKTGSIQWKFSVQGAIRSTPLLYGGKLYLNGGDGSLYALDPSRGKLQWKCSGKGEKKYDFADYHHSSPVCNNGVIYFGSGDGNLYAVNPADGKIIWSFQTGDAVHDTAAIVGGKVLFGSFDGNFYAVNVADGQLAWKFKTTGHRYFPKGEVQGSPAVFGDEVIFGTRDFNVYARSITQGTGLWNKAFPRGWGLVNVIKDSVLYTGTGDERTLFTFDPVTGRELWKKKMELLVFGDFAFSDKLMYVGTTMGKLHAIDRKTGETRWTFATEGYEKNHLKYFKQDDTYRDDIYSIIKSNEQFLDAQCALGGIFSTPAREGNTLVVATTDGMIYCLAI